MKKEDMPLDTEYIKQNTKKCYSSETDIVVVFEQGADHDFCRFTKDVSGGYVIDDDDLETSRDELIKEFEDDPEYDQVEPEQFTAELLTLSISTL